MPDATPQKCSLTPVNDKAVLLNFEGAVTTSNAGLMLLSKTDQKLSLSSSLASCLKDPRNPAKTLHSLEEIIGFRVAMIAIGYEDGNDANELGHDPSSRWSALPRPELRCAPSLQSHGWKTWPTRALLSGWYIRWSGSIATPLNASPRRWCWMSTRPFDEVHGDQQLSLFNGYYGRWGYQPWWSLTKWGVCWLQCCVRLVVRAEKRLQVSSDD